MKSSVLGRSVPRKEGRDKVSGFTKYLDDLSLPHFLHGATVRSTIPRGRIKNIIFDPEIPWDEFTIVRPDDIPGKNCVALIQEDQPVLADGFVNHVEEAILLLAHPDTYLLQKAKKAVTIEYEPSRAVLNLDESLKGTEIIWGKDNLLKSYLLEKGDVGSIWAEADFVIEGSYETGAQEQLYIEPQGMMALVTPQEGVTVWGSMQCPFYVHKALKSVFLVSDEKIRVIQTETGVGFGGKEDYPSMLAIHAGLLSLKSGKPVKIVYSRSEDMAATTKRHPSKTRIKTGVSKDGKILGAEVEFLIDGGAYATVSPVVLSRGTLHATGPYLIDHVRINAKALATNHPPHGAFRGFGAPQSIFALDINE